ncbi:MAG: helix-turn-helix domain-containing protein [Christensenellales bacterium]
MNKFKERLKELRTEKGLSRKNLADKLHISERTVCYWESGKRECSFDTLIELSEILSTNLDYLLGNDEIN